MKELKKKIESNNFAIRKNLLEYDQVMNEQRELIYAQRRRVLKGENMKDNILDMIRDRINFYVSQVITDEVERENWDLGELNRILLPVIPLSPITENSISDAKDVSGLEDLLYQKAVDLYNEKEAEFPNPEDFREVERVILLRVIDRKWMDEINDMDQLREGIGLQAYGQRNPVDEYKAQSYDMMDAMNEAIKNDTVQMLYLVRIERQIEREEVAQVTGTNKDESSENTPKRRASKKIYPNDPCPCKSGKKYKNCHMKSDK